MIALGQERLAQWSKHAWFTGAELVREDQIQSRSRLRLMFIVPVWAIPTAAALDLFHREPKQEEVLLSCLFRHFDGCAVARSDRQGPVHHELHIACSTGLIAGGRNLV